MSRIYTRTGDSGETGLFGGGRVRKDDVRVEAYGTIDELNAVLGRGARRVVTDRRRSWPRSTNLWSACSISCSISVPNWRRRSRPSMARISSRTPTSPGSNSRSTAWEQGLEPLQTFILPGGSPAAAQLHWARTVCRRAERLVVRLAASEPIRGEVHSLRQSLERRAVRRRPRRESPRGRSGRRTGSSKDKRRMSPTIYRLKECHDGQRTSL